MNNPKSVEMYQCRKYSEKHLYSVMPQQVSTETDHCPTSLAYKAFLFPTPDIQGLQIATLSLVRVDPIPMRMLMDLSFHVH